jgi:methyl-accepting chemotaxis protein
MIAKGALIRRTTLLVDKKFQILFVAKFFAAVSAAASATALVVYYFCGNATTTVFVNSRLKVMSTTDFILPGLLVSIAAAVAVVGAATALVAFYFSHRIAGPVYRLCRDVSSFSDGNLAQDFMLREKDEFGELARVLGGCARRMQTDLLGVKTEIDAIEKEVSALPPQARVHLCNLKQIMQRYHG